jgi:hypothetical protein
MPFPFSRRFKRSSQEEEVLVALHVLITICRRDGIALGSKIMG